MTLARSSVRDLLGLGVVAAAAWIAVIGLGQGSGMGMGASMGLPLLAFLGAWALMMTAMMLPAVAPVASLYARSLGPSSGPRLSPFLLGYLTVWTLLGVPGFAAAQAVDRVVAIAPASGRWIVVGVLVAFTAYQLTPLKSLCLSHCRSPLAQFLGYAGYRGRFRHFRVGAHHGLYCAGCCWPLMLLLVSVGTMNVAAMLLLTIVITAEKLVPRGALVTRASAVAAVCLALVLAASPPVFERLTGG